MTPDSRFTQQRKDFWAHVRTLSECIGYTERNTGRIRIPTIPDIVDALRKLGLKSDHVATKGGKPTTFGALLTDYYEYRAHVLNDHVEPRLMDAKRARAVFEGMCRRCKPPDEFIPWNKQPAAKKAPAYLTAIVNMLIHENAPGVEVNFDPRVLTTVTRDGKPLRTLARRVDGAFPSVVNPIAVWEIKEYYYTTTFGSRVADGVYESLLDGMELEELREHEGVDVKHYLIVDAHYTWWECGRSYLCRITDMLHMGYVDEVLFGYEVVERLPTLVKTWMKALKNRR